MPENVHLRHLMRDGRATWADLAVELGLTAPAVAQRVRRLQDPRGRCYTMHWFDSLGIEHDAPGVYRMRLEHSPDGKDWTTILEGSYTRIG